MSGSARDEALCSFEYIDRHNTRSHLCLSCCQCDALDRVGDQLIHGEKPSADMMAELQADVLDRLRIPSAGGARRFEVALLLPNIFIGVVLFLGSLHFALAMVTPLLLMVGINVLYRLWRRGVVTGNLFLSAVPCILLWVYSISVLFITPSCSYALIAAVHGGFAVLAYCIHRTQNGNPGVLAPKYTLKSDDGHPVALPLDACGQCGAVQEELSRHCRFCKHCVRRYDHHCVWLDCCVAAQNHRWFLATIVMILVMSYAYLLCALRADCYSYPGIGPEKMADWYRGACLLHAFAHWRSSWILATFVTVALLTLGLNMMFLQQFLMVSADITYVQAMAASREGNGLRWLLKRYTLSRFLQSWSSFFQGWPSAVPSQAV